MKVRMIGIIREKNTVADPWRWNQLSAHSRCLRLMWMKPVLLEQLDAPVVAHRVRDQRPDQVPQHARGHDPEQGQVPLRDVEAGEQHVASLGIGMQALSSTMSTNTPASAQRSR